MQFLDILSQHSSSYSNKNFFFSVHYIQCRLNGVRTVARPMNTVGAEASTAGTYTYISLCTYIMLYYTYLLHGAKSSLRSWLVLQLVKKFPAFLETEGSSPYSQVPTTCPYPETTPPSPHNPSHFLKNHLNIILPSTSGSPQWSLSIKFPHQQINK